MRFSPIVSKTLGRVLLFLGLADVQTSHEHPITGIPIEPPVPKKVSSPFNSVMLVLQGEESKPSSSLPSPLEVPRDNNHLLIALPE